jgi:hypothetical protein
LADCLQEQTIIFASSNKDTRDEAKINYPYRWVSKQLLVRVIIGLISSPAVVDNPAIG